jgi:5'(3')-deoxyribonucleotidase
MLDFDLYIDSDGVICGFDELAYEILGGRFIHEVPKGTLWAAVERHGSFFESLPLIDGAERLIQYAQSHFKNVSILTATGYTPHDAAEQKKRWYTKHFPALTVHVVSKSSDKAVFAHPRAILVDDRAKSIDPWVAAGGIGILHTSVDDTIDRLRQFVT